MYREAGAIYPEKPQAALSAGVLLANGGQTDSAIVYFARAADAADRAGMSEERNQATHNLAAMLQRAERHQEAAAALEKYLGWVPEDKDAKRALAVSYAPSGARRRRAAWRGEVGDSPAATPEDAIRTAINLYDDKKYADATQAFERVLAAAPYSRDAVYRLAASYQALEDGPTLIAAARKLLEIEPMNPEALRLLVAGYQLTKQADQAVEPAKQLVGLATGVAVERFTTGRSAETVSGKPIAPAPVALTFEFVDSASTVVATEAVAVPALKRD
ncbi:MAG: tetratricopeptide repeat protein [Gemmatimonadales bacterium]